MGCDIHLRVEQKIKGVWQSADNWMLDKDDDPPRMCVSNEIYGGRNYNLFAILANVRNGRGFAGVKTGEGFNPIAMPRGIPPDATERVAAEQIAWDCDGHSHSWLTLREILDFDWNQKTELSGWVDAQHFDEWKRCGAPESYSGGVSGSAVRHVSNEEMADEIAIAEKSNEERRQKTKKFSSVYAEPSLSHLFTEVRWDRYYWQCMGEEFALAVVRSLHKANPEDVRFVFFFDN